MWSGWRLILRIAIAKAANPAHVIEALLECREATQIASMANKSFVALPDFAWLSSINPGGSLLFPHAHRGAPSPICTAKPFCEV